MADEARPTTRRCGTMQVHHHMLDTRPAYVAARRDIEDFTFTRVRQRVARREAVVSIPTVVHVVWHEEDQNITDEQVHSQLTVLNRDFRAANPDTAEVPEVWRDLVADARVEFALATLDPAGGATTGITRTRTDRASFGTGDEVKFAESGGADAWPTDRFLNLWVCPLSGGVLGYAQFPGGDAVTDGVVLTHTAFGTVGTAAPPFNGGRTAVHEVGHWLNLRHIWGDDGEGCSGTDFVADTPNQGGPSSGVPTFPSLSCDNAPHGDMFVNYMDYTDDSGMVMFTAGQVERMDACLAGPRKSFLDITVSV